MKSSQILRKAARRVEQEKNRYGCTAIEDTGRSWPEIRRAKDWFALIAPGRVGGYWWPVVEREPARILGLYLAAAIAESEGD